MKTFAFAAILFLLAPFSARAASPSPSSSPAPESCPEVELDVPGGSMEHIPVTYQGHVGICYGHAAAQMIDAYRFSHPDGDKNYDHQTSPFEVAVGVTHEDDPKDDYDDGAYTVCPSIRYAMKAGSADSAWVEELYSESGFERSDFVNRLRQYYQDYAKHAAKAAGFDAQTEAALKDFESYASPEARADLPDASALVSYAQAATFTDATYDFLEPYCSEKPRVRVPSSIVCRDSGSLGAQQIYARVHQLLLEKNAQPVAVKMCRNIFEQGHTYVGVTAKGMRSDCLLHWPLIIGQKMIGGQCRFLVRNSMGTDDTGYSTDWLPRDHGNLWIDEQTLINNTFDMSYLK